MLIGRGDLEGLTKNKVVLKRCLVAIIFIPIFVLVILCSHQLVFLALTCSIIAWALYEFFRAVVDKEDKSVSLYDISLGILIPLSFFFTGERVIPLVLIVIIFLVFLHQFFLLRISGVMRDISFSLTGILYVSFLLSYLILLRAIPGMGKWLVLTTFFITWMGDSGAYFVGKMWGRHRFFSILSAHKTVEGFIGAISLSLTGALISYCWLPLPWYHILVLGGLGGVMGQLGDFFESMLKRGLGIKDFGKFLPGHGGLLDRFDSMIFVAPFFYYYYQLFIAA